MKATGYFNKLCSASGRRRPAAHTPARHQVAVRDTDATSSLVGAVTAVMTLEPVSATRQDNVPHVLHIDADSNAALELSGLLMVEARITHVTTLAAARQLLQREIFSLVVLDPSLPDGDASALLPALSATPLLVHSARAPLWREAPANFLPKPWTPPRQLWNAVAKLLGLSLPYSAGD